MNSSNSSIEMSQKQKNPPNKFDFLYGFLVLLAAASWPFLNLIATNIDENMPLGRMLIYVFVTFTALLTLVVFLKFMIKSTFRHSVVTIGCGWIFVFFYGVLREWLIPLGLSLNLVLGIWSVLFLLIVFVCLKLKNQANLVFIISAIISGMSLSLLFTMGFAKYSVHSNNILEVTTPIDLEPFKEKPNVYYILIDAYPREDTLSEALDYNNEFFLGSLRQKGFIIPKNATTGYPYTINSISALMTMNYVHDTNSPSRVIVDTKNTLRGQNPVVNKFKHENYKFILAPTGVFIALSCGGEEDICFSKNFAQEAEIALIGATPLSLVIFENERVAQFGADEAYVKASAEDFTSPADMLYFAKEQVGPFFFLGHLGGVHEAMYNSNCSLGRRASPRIHNEPSKKHFLHSIRCTNKEILVFVDELIKKDPDAIIVLQSDHGPHIGLNRADKGLGDTTKWLPQNSEEARNKFGILSAIRMPANCEELITNDWSTINTFRNIFACLAQNEPNLLETQSYFRDPISNDFIYVSVDGKRLSD